MLERAEWPPMFHVILFQPEIPPNTGNAIRLCANTGAHLHLVKPLGFSLDDRHLARAGLDYHDLARVSIHEDWAACKAALGDARLFALSSHASRRYDLQAFRSGDAFLFGRETAGLSGAVLEDVAPSMRLKLPMCPANRSLNLSNSVAVVVYEAWRQCGFAGSAQI